MHTLGQRFSEPLRLAPSALLHGEADFVSLDSCFGPDQL